jgi:hypothetical protein
MFSHKKMTWIIVAVTICAIFLMLSLIKLPSYLTARFFDTVLGTDFLFQYEFVFSKDIRFFDNGESYAIAVIQNNPKIVSTLKKLSSFTSIDSKKIAVYYHIYGAHISKNEIDIQKEEHWLYSQYTPANINNHVEILIAPMTDSTLVIIEYPDYSGDPPN